MNAISVRVGVRLFGAVLGLYALTLLVAWFTEFLRPQTRMWFITPYVIEEPLNSTVVDIALVATQLLLPASLLAVAVGCLARSHRIARMFTRRARLV